MLLANRVLKRAAVLVASLLVLTGCASVKLPLENGRLTPAAGQGIAIVAFTAQSFSPDTADAQLFIQGANGRAVGYTRLVTDFIRAPGDTQNSVGRLLVLPLPAGQYAVTRAAGSWLRDSGTLIGNYQYVDVPLNAPFKVAAGEVVYLGQVHLNMNLRGEVAFSQNSTRDFYDLQVRSGVTDTSNIQIRPLAATPAGQ